MDIKNPHDKFFLESFQHKSVAIAYVQNFLPKAVHTQLDYETFKLDNQSYINETLQDFFSDIVYECKTIVSAKGNKTTKLRIALLFEHKSYVPKYPLLQVLEYILSIWKADQKQKRALTLVIPIVIYHGEQEWKHKRLTDMFEVTPDFMQPFIPNFEIHLTNISTTSDDTIKKIGANFLTNTFLALKYSRHLTYVLDNFEKMFIFREQFLNSTLGDNQFKALFVYLSTVTKIKDMKNLIQELPVDLQEKGLSAYERAQLEGEKRVLWKLKKSEKEIAQLKLEKVRLEKARKQAELEKKRLKAISEKARKQAELEKKRLKAISEKARKQAELEKAESEKARKQAEAKEQKMILNLLNNNILSEKQIADMMNIPMDYILDIKNKSKMN